MNKKFKLMTLLLVFCFVLTTMPVQMLKTVFAQMYESTENTTGKLLYPDVDYIIGDSGLQVDYYLDDDLLFSYGDPNDEDIDGVTPGCDYQYDPLSELDGYKIVAYRVLEDKNYASGNDTSETEPRHYIKLKILLAEPMNSAVSGNDDISQYGTPSDITVSLTQPNYPTKIKSVALENGTDFEIANPDTYAGTEVSATTSAAVTLNLTNAAAQTAGVYTDNLIVTADDGYDTQTTVNISQTVTAFLAEPMDSAVSGNDDISQYDTPSNITVSLTQPNYATKIKSVALENGTDFEIANPDSYAGTEVSATTSAAVTLNLTNAAAQTAGVYTDNLIVTADDGYDTQTTVNISQNVIAFKEIDINANNFPDDVFRQYVSDNFDTDKSGTLSYDELNNAKIIDVNNKNVSRLNGIELLPYITGISCQNNRISSLDLTANHALSSINCDAKAIGTADLSSLDSLKSFTFYTGSTDGVLNLASCGTNFTDGTINITSMPAGVSKSGNIIKGLSGTQTLDSTCNSAEGIIINTNTILPGDDSNSSGGSSGGGSSTTDKNTTYITASQASSAINASAEKKDASLEFKSTVGDSSEDITFNLSKEAIDAFVNAKVKEVTLSKGGFKITLDLETLKALAAKNSDITISAKKIDTSKLSDEAKAIIANRPVYDFTAKDANGNKITSFGKGTISISIPYTKAADEKTEDIAAYYVDEKGNVKKIENSTYDEKKGILAFDTNHFSIYGAGYVKTVDTTTSATPVFTDISKHWAKSSIEYIVSLGLMNGTDKQLFSPDMNISRGMFVTVLARLSGADLSSYTASSFKDVKAGSYYAGAIEWAAKNGIAKGISETEFAPDADITREQMAVMMTNYAKAMGITLPKTVEKTVFADNGKISAYAANAVETMQTAGLISGKNNNLFDPQGTATRAEVCSLLERFINLK